MEPQGKATPVGASCWREEMLGAWNAEVRGAAGEKERWSGRRGEKLCPPCGSLSVESDPGGGGERDEGGGGGCAGEGEEDDAPPPASEDWGGVPSGSGPRAGTASLSSSRVFGFISARSRVSPGPSRSAAGLLTGKRTGSETDMLSLWAHDRALCQAGPANETCEGEARESWVRKSHIRSPTHAMSGPGGGNRPACRRSALTCIGAVPVHAHGFHARCVRRASSERMLGSTRSGAKPSEAPRRRRSAALASGRWRRGREWCSSEALSGASMVMCDVDGDVCPPKVTVVEKCAN